MSPLLTQLLIASAMVVLTVIILLMGLALVARMLRAGRRLPEQLKLAPISLLIGAAIVLFAIHTVEIWSFAALYLLLNAAPDFEQGLQFSTVTCASIEYGDVLHGQALADSRSGRESHRGSSGSAGRPRSSCCCWPSPGSFGTAG